MSNKLIALVVDDDITANTRLAHVAQSDNINVVLVRTIDLASDYFESGLCPDLLLVHWGHATKEKTKAFLSALRLRGFDTPVVFLTQYGYQTEKSVLVDENAFEYGAVAVINKPYDYETMNRQLKILTKIAQTKKKAQEAFKPSNTGLFSNLYRKFA